jgi:hypothetical protein
MMVWACARQGTGAGAGTCGCGRGSRHRQVGPYACESEVVGASEGVGAGEGQGAGTGVGAGTGTDEGTGTGVAQACATSENNSVGILMSVYCHINSCNAL